MGSAMCIRDSFRDNAVLGFSAVVLGADCVFLEQLKGGLLRKSYITDHVNFI